MAHAWVNVTYLSEADYNEWAERNKAKTAAASAPVSRQ
jgi:hypothetical protein